MRLDQTSVSTTESQVRGEHETRSSRLEKTRRKQCMLTCVYVRKYVCVCVEIRWAEWRRKDDDEKKMRIVSDKQKRTRIAADCKKYNENKKNLYIEWYIYERNKVKEDWFIYHPCWWMLRAMSSTYTFRYQHQEVTWWCSYVNWHCCRVDFYLDFYRLSWWPGGC